MIAGSNRALVFKFKEKTYVSSLLTRKGSIMFRIFVVLNLCCFVY